MMPTTRREALRAVAKLALGAMPAAALAGCGGKIDFAHPDAGSGKLDVAHADADSPARQSPMTEPPAVSAPDAACALPGVVALTQNVERVTTFTKAELECCVAHLDGVAGPNGAVAMMDSESANCCNATIAAVDVSMLAFTDVTEEVRMLCCFSGREGREALWPHALCSPWGPPVPPFMGWSLEGIA